MNHATAFDNLYAALIKEIRANVGVGRTTLDEWAEEEFKKYGDNMTVSDLAHALNINLQTARIGIKNGVLPGIIYGDGERTKYIIHTAMYIAWVFNYGHTESALKADAVNQN